MTSNARLFGRSDSPHVLLWCAERGHPIITYSPWLDVSLCRCAEVVLDGCAPMDWDAMWQVSHSCPPGTKSCGCYTRRTRARS